MPHLLLVMERQRINKRNQKISIEHPYGLSKYLGEKAVMHWNKVYKLPANSMRIFNAYGPRVRTTGVYGAVIGVFLKKNKKTTNHSWKRKTI